MLWKQVLFWLCRVVFHCWKVLMGSSEVMHDPRQKVKLVSRKREISLSRAITTLFQVGFYQSKLQIVIHS